MSKNDAITMCNSLIYKIMSYYKGYNKEDLYQSGCIGVLKALKKYNGSFGTKFTSYAFDYIRGEIIDFISRDRNIKVSDTYISLYKKYIQVKNLLTSKFNREPTLSEISSFMDISLSDLVNILEGVMFTKSIEADELDIPSSMNIDNIELREEIERLEEPNRSIIVYRYYYGLTQCEIASKLGLSQVKVSRKENESLRLIKKELY